jgi:riboflavin synthase
LFTGIVQTVGTILSADREEWGARLVVDTTGWVPALGYEPALGDSIAISGVCLTLVAIDPGRLAFDVVAETLDRSKLAALGPGDSVNIEPALLPNQPLGGHFVQGHVDGVGQVSSIKTDASDRRIRIEVSDDIRDYLVPKGGIAVDGVSLTIADLGEDWFSVALIPTTLDSSLTTLSALEAGDTVNLEADVLTKTTVEYLRRQGGNAPQT